MAYTGSFLRKMKIRGFYSLSDCVFSITACRLLMLAGKGLHEIYLIWGASRCLAEASWGGKMGPETISGIGGLWKPPRESQGLKIESPADWMRSYITQRTASQQHRQGSVLWAFCLCLSLLSSPCISDSSSLFHFFFFPSFSHCHPCPFMSFPLWISLSMIQRREESLSWPMAATPLPSFREGLRLFPFDPPSLPQSPFSLWFMLLDSWSQGNLNKGRSRGHQENILSSPRVCAPCFVALDKKPTEASQ